ncbi:MAG: L-arabinose isomerase [Oscillospiraceae bacterium]|nr:L-arabinose isomerase [Oscillospiraceae bacterium]
MKREKEFWFVVGSQFLYGNDVLDTIDKRAKEMAEWISDNELIPFPVVYKGTVKTVDEAVKIVKDANYQEDCLGLITWCHTFSPSKLWINALTALQKPYCHFATQYNEKIPDKEIDMDFMNLNQAAHGDREHGFIGARLRIPRKVIVGFWKNEKPLKELGKWMRAAYGVAECRNLKVCRFGDNMRDVAVTEGDKVETQIKFGWQVNTWAVGDLVKEMNNVSDEEIERQYKDYLSKYDVATDNEESIKYQAREEIAIKKILDRVGAKAFTNTFEDLYGMKQLPGLASQDLMAQGYGFGAEGDWKVSALTHVVKVMTEGMSGGTSMMEDYTYNLPVDEEYSLGAHMLEVCPSLAGDKPRIETHHLGIGMNEDDPARLVFEGKAGKATVASLIDMGGRMRLIVQDIEVVKPIYEMPNLPVARVMWKLKPDLPTAVKMWILCGGAHHTVLSYDADADMYEDFAEMMGIEFVHLNGDTDISDLKLQLMLSDFAWKLR